MNDYKYKHKLSSVMGKPLSSKLEFVCASRRSYDHEYETCVFGQKDS